MNNVVHITDDIFFGDTPMKAMYIFACAIALTVAQADADEPKSIPTPPMLEHLESEGGSIVARFKINDHLNGFAVVIGPDRIIVYATADGKYLFNGSLLDKNAEDLTPGFSEKYLPDPDAEDKIKLLEESAFIGTHSIGSGRKIYVIHDPACPYCKEAHKTVMQHEYAKKVEVRWIPVAALGKQSAEMASALLASKEPMKLQADYGKGYQLSVDQVKKSEDRLQDVINNTRIMKTLGVSGTPAFIVVEDGKIIKTIHGFRRGDILTALGV